MLWCNRIWNAQCMTHISEYTSLGGLQPSKWEFPFLPKSINDCETGRSDDRTRTVNAKVRFFMCCQQALCNLAVPVSITQQPSRREGTHLPDTRFCKKLPIPALYEDSGLWSGLWRCSGQHLPLQGSVGLGLTAVPWPLSPPPSSPSLPPSPLP